MSRNILVTGVSKGLGLEITKTLLENNYNVFGISREFNDSLSELKSIYEKQLHWMSYDLELPENISKTIFKNWIGLDKPLHGFVNNAAFAYDDLITNINLKQLERMYRVNVYSPMILVKYVIRQMLLHKVKGSIIHISSISVHTGYKGLGMYASSKGALEAFSKNTAREWGSIGVRSNCIVAGFMETEMSASLSDEQKSRIYKRTSLKKETSILSVSKTVEFLLSDNSDSITGQNIFVDSGTI